MSSKSFEAVVPRFFKQFKMVLPPLLERNMTNQRAGAEFTE